MANIATKEQERKALDKIRKIIEELGENSYIGTAIDGCLELAQENIDNDFGFSMKENWLVAQKKCEKHERTIERMYKEDEAKAEEIKRLIYKQNCLENRIKELKEQNERLANLAINERKDIEIETADGERICTSFEKMVFFPATEGHPFAFINVVEKSGWTTSYKMGDIKSLEIQ